MNCDLQPDQIFDATAIVQQHHAGLYIVLCIVGSYPQLVPLSKALYPTCFIHGQECKSWSCRPKLTLSMILNVEPIIYIYFFLMFHIFRLGPELYNRGLPQLCLTSSKLSPLSGHLIYICATPGVISKPDNSQPNHIAMKYHALFR